MIRVFSKWLPEYYRGIGIKEGLKMNMENPRTWWYFHDDIHIRFCAHVGDVFWFIIEHKYWYYIQSGHVYSKRTNNYPRSNLHMAYCRPHSSTCIFSTMHLFKRAMRNEKNAFAAYIAKWYLGLASVRRSLGLWIPKDLRKLLASYFNLAKS